MLNKMAFANSLAALSGALYVVMYILASALPGVNKALMNARFYGAQVSASSRTTFDITALVVAILAGWVVGYAWAWLYHKFAK